MKLASLPDSYFIVDESVCWYAARITKCIEQSKHLIENLSSDLKMKVKTRYPQLFAYLMGPVGPGHQFYTFGEWITATYKQPNSLTDLKVLIKDMESDLEMELLWCQNHERFHDVIHSINAQVELDLQSDPNQLRQAVMLCKNSETIMSQLMGLKNQT